ncbi:unnamed protein product [Amoebophrya sp. A120]|nr:unnamed protein product [Amoebophrya sp. A120]|eukprot:GSA120T00009212001.1
MAQEVAHQQQHHPSHAELHPPARVEQEFTTERDLGKVTLKLPASERQATDDTGKLLNTRETIGSLGYAVPFFALTASRWSPLRELSYDDDPENETWSEWFTRQKYGVGMYQSLMYHNSLSVVALLLFHYAEEWSPGELFPAMLDETIVTLFTGILAFTLVFRINLAYMRWWDSRRLCDRFASKLINVHFMAMAFDQYSVVSDESKAVFRTRLAALLSLFHAEGSRELGDIKEMKQCLGYRLCEEAELEYYLDRAKNPDTCARSGPLQVFLWLQMLLTGRFHDEHFVSPPVIARLYTSLDEALDAFYAAMVIRSTPFPKPFVLMLNFALFLVKLVIPMVIHQTGLALHWKIPLLCFCVYGFFGIGRVAVELEHPFGSDFYDHPLENWQLDLDITLFDAIHRCGHTVPKIKCQVVGSRTEIDGELEDTDNFDTVAMTDAALRCRGKKHLHGCQPVNAGGAQLRDENKFATRNSSAGAKAAASKSTTEVETRDLNTLRRIDRLKKKQKQKQFDQIAAEDHAASGADQVRLIQDGETTLHSPTNNYNASNLKNTFQPEDRRQSGQQRGRGFNPPGTVIQYTLPSRDSDNSTQMSLSPRNGSFGGY